MSSIVSLLFAALGVLALLIPHWVRIPLGVLAIGGLLWAAFFAQKLSRTDALTGLQNRHGLNTLIQKKRNSTAAVGVLFLDLDLLKTTNDHLGYSQGDLRLRQLAALLRQETRTSGQAFRIGGDEFLVVLSLPDNAEHLSEILLQSGIGVSVGIARGPARELSALIATASRNMQQSRS